ncbi:MAG: hypothetical protein OEN02_16145, partial [Gammaproteobacteria bacterium]|nr:hypothetical protein [Gammaproteobacteria bacterium]
MTKTWLLGAGLLALVACDSGTVAVVEGEAGEKSEELRTFLEAPAQPVKPGAHRQSDPHAQLGPDKMAQVALQHLDEARAQLALDRLGDAIGKYPDNVMLLSVRA